MSIKRINKELIEIQKENIFETKIINDDIFKWECILKGSENTAYENGVFKLLYYGYKIWYRMDFLCGFF